MDDHKCKSHKEDDTSKDEFNDACCNSGCHDTNDNDNDAGGCCDAKSCDSDNDKGGCCSPAP